MDFARYCGEPLLGPHGPVVIESNVGLEFLDPTFLAAQLSGQLVGDVERVPVLFIEQASRVAQQLKDRIAGIVDRIGRGTPVVFRCELQNTIHSKLPHSYAGKIPALDASQCKPCLWIVQQGRKKPAD